MKILILKDYYYPENCAGISLTEDLVETFVSKGHEVILYTPTPTRGVNSLIRKKYKKRKKEILYDGKFIIYRYALFKEYHNVFFRTLRYLIQNVIQIIKSLRVEADVIFLGSTPPTMGIVGTIVKKIKKIPFIYNVQDIFPDSLITTNLAKENSIAWRIGNYISNLSYKNANHIIVISEDMKNNLLNKKVETNKITIIPNWVNTSKIKYINRDNNFLFKELELEKNKFNVVYAGNVGEAQNIEMIVKTAELLTEYTKIQFIIFGAGSKFNEIKEMIRIKKLSNIKIFPLRNQDEVSEVYSLSDLSLISCKKGVGNSGVPSKTWSILATGTPIIACFDKSSSLSQLILKEELGIVVEPDDFITLKQSILHLLNNFNEMKRIKYNVHKYVSNNISNVISTNKYEEILTRIVSEVKK